MGKSNKKIIKSFEKNPESNDLFTMLYHDLLMNNNFLNLSSNSKILYIYMLKWARDNNKRYLDPQEYDNDKRTLPDKIAYSYSLARKVIGTNDTFKSSINELMYYGFLLTPDEIIKNGLTENYKTNKKGELIKDKHGQPIVKDYKDYMNNKKNTNSNAKMYYFSSNWYKIDQPKLSKGQIDKIYSSDKSN